MQAALLQAMIILGLALLCLYLHRRYHKPYFAWWALAWFLYFFRLGAILSFLVTKNWDWLYWHQVLTGWTALVLLWAALVFSRQVEWRWGYAGLLLFPPAWSYLAIYRLDNFMLAAGPAVLFLSLVTLWTGWIFFRYYRLVRATGALVLAVALFLWSIHHLDYPFLRAYGAWSPWGYYLDILFLLATGSGILVLVLDDLRRGISALSTLSGDLQPADPHSDSLATLLQRPLTLPAALGSAIYESVNGTPHCLAGAGTCAGWEGYDPPAPASKAVTAAIAGERAVFSKNWPDPRPGSGRVYPFAVVLPVWRRSRATAALAVVGDARDPFTALDQDFLHALGQQIGAALENADLTRRLQARTAELAQLSARMIEQHEAERRRLSLELHDETAQVFTAVKLQLGLLREQADQAVAGRLARAEDLIDAGMKSIRKVTDQLRPSLLDDLGLLPALRSLGEAFTERSGIPVEITAPDALPEISAAAELALFRALQETLSNVARHAGAHLVRVHCAVNGALSLQITDDGRGLPAGFDMRALEREGHLGLAGMRERIIALGGRVEVTGAPGAGVSVRVELPLRESGE
ncbi:MAG TPA: GAF domain-containing sensor histidine kinase [Gemmatimonadales bacterium]|nr:GAF domain-containing sensor histidine kinase [Gemmatimonadales bacterium]